ncbi:MAG: bifunctional pyr operon transcriptional regulator/uracil phosphoribosyltransferase PyrR [Gemmatimonadetes bacterium]|nr:bifunctional pyr operon transcriptional regulator/uracil phosphoribosyltransferase PyrR [Gemmatimonadota bacterium]
MKVERSVMGRRELQWAVTRLAHQILEKNRGTKDLAIVGVRTRGAHLAVRIVDEIEKIEGTRVPLGILDITLYRDDLQTVAKQPVVKGTEILFDVEDKVIVLVDDVLYTGRTVRASLDALIDFGRPRRIWLSVLVDRGHRELPVAADFVGEDLFTTSDEIVHVKLDEVEGEEDGIVVTRRES